MSAVRVASERLLRRWAWSRVVSARSAVTPSLALPGLPERAIRPPSDGGRMAQQPMAMPLTAPPAPALDSRADRTLSDHLADLRFAVAKLAENDGEVLVDLRGKAADAAGRVAQPHRQAEHRDQAMRLGWHLGDVARSEEHTSE